MLCTIVNHSYFRIMNYKFLYLFCIFEKFIEKKTNQLTIDILFCLSEIEKTPNSLILFII